MPKAHLSNDKGLVQSSGNGLRLTPKNSLTGGLHFKTVEVQLAKADSSTSVNSNANRLVTYVGMTLPENSIILGASCVVTELSNNDKLLMTLGHTSVTNKTLGQASVGEVDILASVEAGGADGTLNKAFGTFLDTGKSVTDKTSLVFVEEGSTNTNAAMDQGRVVVTIAYSGVES